MTQAAEAESYCRGFRLSAGQPLIINMAEACFFARNGVNVPRLVEDGVVHIVSLRVGEDADLRPVRKAFAKKAQKPNG